MACPVLQAHTFVAADMVTTFLVAGRMIQERCISGGAIGPQAPLAEAVLFTGLELEREGPGVDCGTVLAGRT